MEDRHTLSEPRLTSTSSSTSSQSSLVWLVDIYRKGVTNPVDTIEISNKTLPPRLNKKGKVLWRLPDDEDRLPSFGVNEQRRIMELFKGRRKNRKKKGGNNKTSSAVGDIGSGGDHNEYDNGDEDGNHNNNHDHDSNHITSGTDGDDHGGKEIVNVGSNEQHQQQQRLHQQNREKSDSNNPNEPEHIDEITCLSRATSSASSASPTPPSSSKKKKRKKRKSTLKSSPSPTTTTTNKDTSIDDYHQLDNSSVSTDNELISQPAPVSPPIPPPPPGLGGGTIPPPGFQDSFTNSLRLDDDENNNNCGSSNKGDIGHEPNLNEKVPAYQSLEPNLLSSPSLDASKSRILSGTSTTTDPSPLHDDTSNNAISTTFEATATNASTTATNTSTSTSFRENNIPLRHQSYSHPQRRYIVIPEQDRPTTNIMSPSSLLQPKPSLAVAAAKTFVDLYYPHILHGLSSDLAMYYTLQAQKSISVGGAHSVVASQADIMLQLSRFAGSSFVVRGVVSQDTFDGYGAHILVTGIVQTNLNTTGLTSFAHSISLVRKEQHHIRSSFTGGVAGLTVGGGSDDEYSFQIHNDALSLLTVSDMIASEQP